MTKEFLQNHLTKLEEAKGLEFEIQQMYQTLKSPIIGNRKCCSFRHNSWEHGHAPG